jgi:hypothetical protein
LLAHFLAFQSEAVGLFHFSHSPQQVLANKPQHKRLCPLLNGTRPRDQNPDDTASLGSTNAPVAASFVNLD